MANEHCGWAASPQLVTPIGQRVKPKPPAGPARSTGRFSQDVANPPRQLVDERFNFLLFPALDHSDFCRVESCEEIQLENVALIARPTFDGSLQRVDQIIPRCGQIRRKASLIRNLFFW